MSDRRDIDPMGEEYYDWLNSAVTGAVNSPNWIRHLSNVIDRAIHMSASQRMMQRSIARNSRWASIPVGKTCAFCLMWAAKGAVLRGDNISWHADCDCQIVPYNLVPQGWLDVMEEVHHRIISIRGEKQIEPGDYLLTMRRAFPALLTDGVLPPRPPIWHPGMPPGTLYRFIANPADLLIARIGQPLPPTRAGVPRQRGGHLYPTSPFRDKSMLGPSWTPEMFDAAIQSVIDRPALTRWMGTSLQRRGEVDGVIFHVDSYIENGVPLMHGYPLSGPDVTKNGQPQPINWKQLTDMDE